MTTAIKKLFSGKDSSAPHEASSFRVIPRAAPPKPDNSPRILIIGAGSRGRAYARSIVTATNGTVVGVAEPDEYKRRRLVQECNISDELVFTSWTELVGENRGLVMSRVDGVCVCTLDETHEEVCPLPFPSFSRLRSGNLNIITGWCRLCLRFGH